MDKVVYPLCSVSSYMGSGGITPPIVNLTADGCEW